MKLKILRTIVFYLGVLILSYSVYLESGFSEGFGFFGAMLMASVIYLGIEYGSFDKIN